MPLNQLCARMHKQGYQFASLAVNPPGASADTLLHANSSRSRSHSSSSSTSMMMEDGPKPIPAWYWACATCSTVGLEMRRRVASDSVLAPPVSSPVFQSIIDMRQAAQPQRTRPMGEWPTLSSPGMLSRVWIWAVNDLVPLRVPSLAYTITPS
jgi:hypothetical protein